MSEFKIKRAYDDFARLGSWENVNYGLIYTCNAGWVDLGHLNPTSSRNRIGASNLWSQVSRGGPAVIRDACSWANADLNIGYEAVRQWWNGCFEDPYVRFAGNQTGYLVSYRQDHGGLPGKPGVGGRYVVKNGLTENQKKSVALAIFMEVSHRFERFQRLMGLGGMITDSGYSQEDLVSNLIGFYIGIGNLKKKEAIRLCHPVSQETAEAVWQKHGAVGDDKNENFSPVLRNTYREDDVQKMCTDDCVGQPRMFPKQFKRVRPAEHGRDYIRISTGSIGALDLSGAG